MDVRLHCNNHTDGYCRKELREEAFVTTCSHVFCIDCVQKHAFHDHARGRRKCLACEADLATANDVILIHLRPSEAQQSTVLSGLEPTVILECAGRALRFWNYQMSTEILWQEHLNKEMATRFNNMQKKAERLLQDAKSEAADLHAQVEAMSMEKQQVENRANEIATMYKEKSKRCHNFENMYEALKRKELDRQTRGVAAAALDNTLQGLEPVATSKSTSNAHQNIRRPVYHPHRPQEMLFDTFKDSGESHPIERLHPQQRSGSVRGNTSSEIAMGTRANFMPPSARAKHHEYPHRSNTLVTPSQRMSLDSGRSATIQKPQTLLSRQPDQLRGYVQQPTSRISSRAFRNIPQQIEPHHISRQPTGKTVESPNVHARQSHLLY